MALFGKILVLMLTALEDAGGNNPLRSLYLSRMAVSFLRPF